MFHTDSIYEYNVIIIVLAEEFEGQFKVLGVNTEKYVTFSVPVQKEIENDKKKKKIACRIKIIYSVRFTVSSLLTLVDNLAEGIYNSKCKGCKSCLEYVEVKDY